MAYSRPTLFGTSTLCTPIFDSHKHLGYFVRLCFISVILSQFLYGCCKTFRIFSLTRISFCSESVNEMNSHGQPEFVSRRICASEKRSAGRRKRENWGTSRPFVL